MKRVTKPLDKNPEHPLQPYWDLAAAAVQVEALNTALSLDLLEPLATPQTAAEVAARLALDVGNTAHLLELLWSMGLLERTGSLETARFVVSEVARSHFLRAAPAGAREAWLYRQARLRQAADLLCDQVRQGSRPETTEPLARFAKQWAAAARGPLAEEQHAATVPAALEILARLPEFPTARRLLDLGGGPGWVAIALARQHPGLSGMVFDFPEAVAVAAENIAAAGLENRLAVLGGDLGTDGLGSGYDLVWCSSVLHFVSDIDATLRKVHAALSPNGVLVCAHAEIAPAAPDAARVLPFYLPLLMQGRHVLRLGETARRMQVAGFERLDQFGSGRFPLAPLQVVIGRKAV